MYRRRRLVFPFSLVAVASLVFEPAAAHAASLDPSPFKLRRDPDNGALDSLPLPKIRDLSIVLDDANRIATRISRNEGNALVRNFAAGFRWNSGDGDTPDWYPQGVTTSSDAYENGNYDGRRVVLVTWYDHTESSPNKGVRLTLVDRTDPLNPRYRHALLVVPYSSGTSASFHALWRDDAHPDIPLHAGGIFWYGDLLYVADTHNGFRVFRLDDIMQVSTAAACDTTIGRRPSGEYCAFGYKYVIPQRFTYTATASNNLRFSFVSLDRSTVPDSVLVGEYDVDGAGTRLVRWSIDFRTRELVATNNEATATWAYQVDIRAMQGAASIDGKYFISRSNGRNGRGDLITWIPGQPIRIHAGVYPPGPEDLTYRPSTDELWTVTEYPGNRMVVAVTAGAF